MAAVFGVLAAGGCYVPIGIHQPQARRNKIHSTAGIRLVLSNHQQINQSELTDQGLEPVSLLDVAATSCYAPLSEPVALACQQPAYIIFTSGSTGEPKGVEMCHRATANTIEHLNLKYGVNESSCALALSALDFDLSVYDLFGLLGIGGRLVLLQEEQRRDAQQWLKLIRRHGVTLWNSVPVLLDMLLVVAEQDTQQLPFEQVMLSGDWIGLDLPVRLSAKSSARFIAMGGATEAAIWSNHYEVTGPMPADWSSIPYGKPLANQRYRVVDVQGRDCPDWVAGELWIGGHGLATGYRGDAQLTQERFVEVAGERWYRTGDRGRYWPDGNLEFLGRLDHQVKVRGHRIELGEIEAALSTVAGVSRAVVVTVGESLSLAAALIPEHNAQLDIEQIRLRLQALLPDYMVPNTFSIEQSLPLSANGKVDRKLLSQELSYKLTADFEIPKGQLEEQIASLWCETLNCQKISRNADFFMLGGDSLVATQIVQLLQKRRISPGTVPLSMIFTSPTIATMAKQIQSQWQKLGLDSSDTTESLFEEGTI